MPDTTNAIIYVLLVGLFTLNIHLTIRWGRQTLAEHQQETDDE